MTLQTKIDFVIWTGDNPPHDIWQQGKDIVLRESQAITNVLFEYFGKLKIPIFPSIGNHEGYPVNSFPPPPLNAWLNDATANQWSIWLPEESLKTVRHGLYYTVKVEPGLRIVSLNMNYCNNMNFWLLVNDTDPAEQLSWLISTLQAAEDAKEKVYILGHIPPGSSDCLITYATKLKTIINRYEDTVAAQFYGHTHRDQFEVFYVNDTTGKEKNHASNIAYIAPSITPGGSHNPSFRVYEIDTVTKFVYNFYAFVADLAKANKSPTGPDYIMQYSPLETYKMDNLLPASWDNLVNQMEHDNSTFNLYLKFKNSGFILACEGKCKQIELCQLRSGDFTDTINCMGGFYNWEAIIAYLEDKLC